MDYWRRKYLVPALEAGGSIALIGIGNIEDYLSNPDVGALERDWDPMRIHKASQDYCIYDIDPQLVGAARELGIKAEVCDVAPSSLGRQFDYVFSSSVIEHVDNPVEFLRNIKDSLHPGGLCVACTPNSIYWRNFVWDRYTEHPEHNFTFNRQHLLNLARKVDLEVIELKSFQTKGGLTSRFKRVFQHIHYLMAFLGRGNLLLLAARKQE